MIDNLGDLDEIAEPYDVGDLKVLSWDETENAFAEEKERVLAKK